jgi:NAD(P)-dependent dehydrogenase (short-subunit alcohol dehydrogenase family)
MGSQILQGKRAVVFGAAGSVGAAVAKEFAAEGAEVFLAGRTKPGVEALAKAIKDAGGKAHPAAVDALDEAAATAYVDQIAEESGRIDIAFNAVGPRATDYGNGKSVVDLPVEQFMIAVDTVLRSQFITARAAARHMVKQKAGAIVLLTGGPAGSHIEGASAIGSAFGAVEALTRNLALDLSPQGVRVVCVRSSAMTDSRTIQETMELLSRRMGMPTEQVAARIASLTMFRNRTASIYDTARAVAFVASDKARMLTSNVINSTGGAVED